MTANLNKILPVFLALFLLPCLLRAADQVRIRDDAPAQYEVVRGDTLWDISGRFLEDPWLWPEVWELNPQIENPHLIYPGDVIELQYNADGPLLTLRRAGTGGAGSGDSNGLRTVKLSPQVRVQSLNNAIPAIPLDRISAVLSGNVVLSQSELDNAPYLLSNRNKNLFSSTNDVVFAKGDLDANVKQFDIIRPGKEYIDPQTRAVLGVEGKMIGTAAVMERGDGNATLRLAGMKEEARAGDRFIPASGNRISSNYFPRPPAFEVQGRILDIVSNRKIGSQYDSIVINKGESDGLKIGDLLALQKPDILVEDTLDKPNAAERFGRALGFNRDHMESFPGETFASVLLYRVFDNTSMGIVIETSEIIRMDDKVVTP